MFYQTIRWLPATLLILLLAGCERPSPTAQVVVLEGAQIAAPTTPTHLSTTPAPTGAPAGETAAAVNAAQTVAPNPTATNTAAPTWTPTPFYTGPTSFACGQLLPLLPGNTTPITTSLDPDPTALANLTALMPDNTRAALTRILEAPETVGLVAYRVGDEANGAYLNSAMQMPLASVIKLINLVAYVEAVAAGQLNPMEVVPLAEIERYYLPNTDLSAHPRAVAELDANGRLLTNPPAVLLEEVPWMMVRHSANAATDYLHMRLGQQAIEETAAALNLPDQTAPCPWIGQFLAVTNHVRTPAEQAGALDTYLANPAQYGMDTTLLTEAYTQDESFRTAEQEWRRGGRRLSGVQREFSHALNGHGTAQAYADLMARIAVNGLSSSESSFLARRYLEWPMQFPVNQERFSNLGYKNGSLPGILTTVYYAYPLGETTPLVIALFYRDLPSDTYRTWRDTLPHDEFARWILAEPAAIPALRAVLQSGDN